MAFTSEARESGAIHEIAAPSSQDLYTEITHPKKSHGASKGTKGELNYAYKAKYVTVVN